MEPSEAKIAGAAVLSLQRYVQAQHGDDAFARVLAKAPPEHAAEVTEFVSTLHWYPTVAVTSLIDVAREMFGPVDFAERLGEASADDQIKTLYRFVLRFTSPSWMMTRGVAMWPRFHNSGKWELVGGENTMRGTLTDFAAPSASICRLLVGWFRRSGQLTGAPNMQVWHPECRVAGKRACVWVAQW